MTITLLAIIGYFVLLLLVGIGSSRFFRGTSNDFFTASHSIGSFLLLMSIVGTTMTAFAMVGSTGKAFDKGIGTYGLMASWSGLVHSAVFFLVGIKIWAIGKKNNYVTQCQFFRERFDSPALGYILFPILVALVIPYVLVGLIGAGSVVRGLTVGSFNEFFPGIPNPKTGQMLYVGAVPIWITGLVMTIVVLTYVILGGMKSTAWVNALQTLIFMATGVLAFFVLARGFGGIQAASQRVLEKAPAHLAREGYFGKLEFLSYCLVPLSVGMFPHLFQTWLTARSAKAFRASVILHPVCILIIWLPCILIGVWAAGAGIKAPGGNSNALFGGLIRDMVHNPTMRVLLVAGLIAAITSSLDTQLIALGTMFTFDFVFRLRPESSFSEKQKLFMARAFMVFIAAVGYLLTFFPPPHIFDLGVWCFSGFSALFPLVFAALYWRRATKAGAIASVFVAIMTWSILFIHTLQSGGMQGEEEPLIAGMLPVVIIFSASLAALIVVSLITAPPTNQTLRKFFPDTIKG